MVPDALIITFSGHGNILFYLKKYKPLNVLEMSGAVI